MCEEHGGSARSSSGRPDRVPQPSCALVLGEAALFAMLCACEVYTAVRDRAKPRAADGVAAEVLVCRPWRIPHSSQRLRHVRACSRRRETDCRSSPSAALALLSAPCTADLSVPLAGVACAWRCEMSARSTSGVQGRAKLPAAVGLAPRWYCRQRHAPRIPSALLAGVAACARSAEGLRGVGAPCARLCEPRACRSRSAPPRIWSADHGAYRTLRGVACVRHASGVRGRAKPLAAVGLSAELVLVGPHAARIPLHSSRCCGVGEECERGEALGVPVC